MLARASPRARRRRARAADATAARKSVPACRRAAPRGTCTRRSCCELDARVAPRCSVCRERRRGRSRGRRRARSSSRRRCLSSSGSFAARRASARARRRSRARLGERRPLRSVRRLRSCERTSSGGRWRACRREPRGRLREVPGARLAGSRRRRRRPQRAGTRTRSARAGGSDGATAGPRSVAATTSAGRGRARRFDRNAAATTRDAIGVGAPARRSTRSARRRRARAASRATAEREARRASPRAPPDADGVAAASSAAATRVVVRRESTTSSARGAGCSSGCRRLDARCARKARASPQLSARRRRDAAEDAIARDAARRGRERGAGVDGAAPAGLRASALGGRRRTAARACGARATPARASARLARARAPRARHGGRRGGRRRRAESRPRAAPPRALRRPALRAEASGSRTPRRSPSAIAARARVSPPRCRRTESPSGSTRNRATAFAAEQRFAAEPAAADPALIGRPAVGRVDARGRACASRRGEEWPARAGGRANASQAPSNSAGSVAKERSARERRSSTSIQFGEGARRRSLIRPRGRVAEAAGILAERESHAPRSARAARVLSSDQR